MMASLMKDVPDAKRPATTAVGEQHADPQSLIDALQTIIAETGTGSHVGRIAQKGLDDYGVKRSGSSSLPDVNELTNRGDWVDLIRNEVESLHAIARAVYTDASTMDDLESMTPHRVDDLFDWLHRAFDTVFPRISATNSECRSLHEMLRQAQKYLEKGKDDTLPHPRRLNSFEWFGDLMHSIDQEAVRWGSLER